jgi:hypothetical protein
VGWLAITKAGSGVVDCWHQPYRVHGCRLGTLRYCCCLSRLLCSQCSVVAAL